MWPFRTQLSRRGREMWPFRTQFSWKWHEMWLERYEWLDHAKASPAKLKAALAAPPQQQQLYSPPPQGGAYPPGPPGPGYQQPANPPMYQGGAPYGQAGPVQRDNSSVIMPIQLLNPYQNKWTIRGRLMEKEVASMTAAYQRDLDSLLKAREERAKQK